MRYLSAAGRILSDGSAGLVGVVCFSLVSLAHVVTWGEQVHWTLTMALVSIGSLFSCWLCSLLYPCLRPLEVARAFAQLQVIALSVAVAVPEEDRWVALSIASGLFQPLPAAFAALVLPNYTYGRREDAVVSPYDLATNVGRMWRAVCLSALFVIWTPYGPNGANASALLIDPDFAWVGVMCIVSACVLSTYRPFELSLSALCGLLGISGDDGSEAGLHEDDPLVDRPVFGVDHSIGGALHPSTYRRLLISFSICAAISSVGSRNFSASRPYSISA